jgi:hypothetical protein
LNAVEIVAAYELSNINRNKLEFLIRRFFEKSKTKIHIIDRFNIPVVPRKCFIAPLFLVDDVAEKVKVGGIGEYSYDSESACLMQESNQG